MMSATASARSLAARSIHIKIHPTARSLADRRSILHVLQDFGTVEMFRSLKYDALPVPNAFLAILASESATTALLNASPLRYTLPSSNRQQELRISRSNFPHAEAIRTEPLHGPYTPVQLGRSVMAADLAASIPSGIAAPGLCHWVLGGEGEAEKRIRERGKAKGVVGVMAGLTTGKVSK